MTTETFWSRKTKAVAAVVVVALLVSNLSAGGSGAAVAGQAFGSVAGGLLIVGGARFVQLRVGRDSAAAE